MASERLTTDDLDRLSRLATHAAYAPRELDASTQAQSAADAAAVVLKDLRRNASVMDASVTGSTGGAEAPELGAGRGVGGGLAQRPHEPLPVLFEPPDVVSTPLAMSSIATKNAI